MIEDIMIEDKRMTIGRYKVRISRRGIGAILIEFAFAIPVFLVLLYYIHDLPKMKLMQRKSQFVAYELAGIVQNIARQKVSTSSPLITINDLGHAFALASLSLFPGNTIRVREDKHFPLGYFPHAIWHYIKGVGSNVCQQKWICSVYNERANTFFNFNTSKDTTVIPYTTASVSASSIVPNFTIDTGETKMIIEFSLLYDHMGKWGRCFADGTPTRSVSTQKAFNFLLASPKKNGENQSSFFPAFAIFSPVPGCFSESSTPQ